MKKFLIGFAIFMAVCGVVFIVLRTTNVCPEYLNMMPMAISPGEKFPEPTLGERLYGWGLCPFTKVVY